MPLDGGNLLFTDDEKIEFINNEPNAEKFIRPLVSAKEFLNGQKRWCLWLIDATPAELRALPNVLKRVKLVQDFRLNSSRKQTIEKASSSSKFGEVRDFGDSFIVIPSTTSENRKYIPMGFFDKNYIPNNSCHIVNYGETYHFGILMSAMHMVWVKYVCGRLKSDYRYSKDIVYNNFPWPENISDKHKAKIEDCAQQVLNARTEFNDSSLADLYNPLTMPSQLVKAHNALDKAVDTAYRSSVFTSNTARIEFLFDLYQKYNATLFPVLKNKK